MNYITEQDADGKRVVECSVCKRTWNTKWPIKQIHHRCGDQPRNLLTELEMSELLAVDPTLAGNRLEAMFKAVGIPPCGGCERRRDYINKCHAWLKELTNGNRS